MHLGLANAVCAAVLAVLAVAAGRWLRRPALTHCLWLLVLVKLVTPPLFSLPLAWLPAETAPDATAQSVALGLEPVFVNPTWEPEVGPPMIDSVWIEMEKERLKAQLVAKGRIDLVLAKAQPDQAVHEPFAFPAALAPAAISRPSEPVVEAAKPEGGMSLFAVLGGVWLAGSVLWFVRAVRCLARFHRLLRHARPAPEEIRDLTARLAREVGLARCPEVMLVPGSLPPMVWAALGRPCVLLPARLLDRIDELQLATLLLHELAHVRRGDHWVRRLEFVALGLFWWYPLAWWARSRLQIAEEQCCDAWVVETLPARAYAAAIVETVDFLAGNLPATPALASGLGRIDGLKRRLTLILSGASPKRLSVAGRLAVLVLALGLLPLLPTLAHSEKEPADAGQKVAPADVGDPGDEALSLRTNPLVLTGGENEIAALAITRDGRFLASGTGYNNRPGEVRVWTVPDHKEVLVYATAAGVASVAFSPDGKYIASSGYDSLAVIREFPSGKVVAVLPLDGTGRLAFSPDGNMLVTATESKTIKLWNAKTGAEIARLDGELLRWYCVGFSTDGKLVAAGGGEFNQENGPTGVTIWDTTTLKQVGKIQGHKGGPVVGLTFSPDGKTLVTGGEDAAARLWQIDGFKPLGMLEGHESRVKSMAFTRDGKTLVTSSFDGTVRLWNVDKQMPITRLDGHVAPVRAVVLTPDDKTIFSGGAHRILKAWDLATHRETASYQPAPEPPGEESIILATAYSPDGKTLATVHENGAVRLRNAANGDLIQTLQGHEDAATCLVFTKDNKTLITGSSDRTVKLWDLSTGQVRATLAGHTSWVYALALSSDGKTLASAGYDKLIRVWDLDTLKEQFTLSGHKGAVRALAFSPDGKVLASGAGDQTIKLWNLEARKEQATFTGHEGTVRALAFSADGKSLASGSEDATVRVWDMAGTAKWVLKGHNGKVCAVAFSPRGRYVVSAGMDVTCRVWDTMTGHQVQSLRGHNDALTSLAWSPDGRFLVTAGYDRSMKLWVVTTGPWRMLTGHTGPVKTAVFSPDGKFILSGGGWPKGDKTLRLWDAQTGKEIRKFEGHTDQVSTAAFAPDGKTILSGGVDSVLRRYDVESGELLQELKGHSDHIIDVKFSRDGRLAVTASHDKTVRIWDLESGRTLHVLTGHTEWVRGADFTPDARRVVSAGRDATVRVWDVEKGTELKRIDLPKEQADAPSSPKEWIDALALSPDGKRVAAPQGSVVRIFDVETGRQLRQLEGHPASVMGVAWSPDGKTLLSGSYDRTARLWDMETGRELHVFRDHRNWVWAVGFSPDGRRILSAGGGGKNGEEYVPGSDFAIRIWPVPDTSLTAGRIIKMSAR
jgi:WD40 repeat protein/beta-lactamase regulating signal transducer with metallopeptidase domain